MFALVLIVEYLVMHIINLKYIKFYYILYYCTRICLHILEDYRDSTISLKDDVKTKHSEETCLCHINVQL